MRTYILIVSLAVFSLAQSKLLSKDDLVEKVVENLKEKRLVKSTRPLPSRPLWSRLPQTLNKSTSPVSEETEIVCLGKDNCYYKAGEQFGMFDNDCYYCKFDSSCDIYCDEDDYCRDEQIKKCLYDGEYYPIHQKVHVGMPSPWRGEDVIFDENCQMEILPHEPTPRIEE